jgi:hypothetical protein
MGSPKSRDKEIEISKITDQTAFQAKSVRLPFGTRQRRGMPEY